MTQDLQQYYLQHMQQQAALQQQAVVDPSQAQRLALDPTQMYLYQQQQLRYAQMLQQMQLQHQQGQMGDQIDDQMGEMVSQRPPLSHTKAFDFYNFLPDRQRHGSRPGVMVGGVEGQDLGEGHINHAESHHGQSGHEESVYSNNGHPDRYHHEHVSLPPLNLQHHHSAV